LKRAWDRLKAQLRPEKTSMIFRSQRGKELLDYADVRTTRKHYQRGGRNAKVRALK
jgi:hypothetical protein